MVIVFEIVAKYDNLFIMATVFAIVATYDNLVYNGHCMKTDNYIHCIKESPL